MRTSEFIYRLILCIFVRGSPSLVGRGIANSMFARTRGFESPSPRHEKLNLIDRLRKFFQWDEEKLKKLFGLVLKMLQLECVLCVEQLVRYSFLVHLEKREQNARNVAKSLNYRSKSLSLHIKISTHSFLRQFFVDR